MNIVLRTIARAAAAALIVAAGTPLSAQIVIHPAPLRVTTDSLARGAEVPVVNLGSTTVVLTSWTLETFSRRDGKEGPGNSATLARGVRVPARSRAVLLVNIDSAAWTAPEAGTYRSNLVVRFADGTAEAQVLANKRQEARTDTTTSDDTVKAALPLVREISLHTRRGWWGRFEGEVYIPVRRGTERNLDTFVVESETAGPALATIDTPRVWEAEPAWREYPVHLSHLRGGRSYTGRVHLGADTAATGVTLTVHASHSVFYFLLTVVAGVLAGLMVRRWTDLGRPISLMRERLLQTELPFRDALEAHAAAGWPREPLAREFETRLGGVDKQVRALSPYLVKNDEVEKKFTAVRAEIEALEGLASALANVTDELTRLRALRAEIAAAIPEVEPPPGVDGFARKIPAALAAADTTLAGTNLTLSTLQSVGTDAASQRAFLVRWATLFHEAMDVKRQHDALGAARNEEEADALQNAEIKVDNVLGDLWKVRDSASLDEAAPAPAIREAEHALRDIAIRRRNAEQSRLVEESARSTDRVELGKSVWKPKADTDPGLPDHPEARQNLLRKLWQRRRSMDWLLAGAAFLVSLITTLSTQYYSGAFGTFSDYVAVLTSSFALTSTMTLLATGLASLQNTGLRALLRR
jgi:hypothetical protein